MLTRISGVLTQFAIVIGIMVTQAMGLKLATPTTWRLVLLFSAALSLAQLLLGTMIVESPVWLSRHGSLRDKDASARRLWQSTPTLRSSDGVFRAPRHVTRCVLTSDGVPAANEDAEDPLLGANDDDDHHEAQPHAVNVPTVLSRTEFRKPLAIVCFSMLCQQLSGKSCPVNATLLRQLTAFEQVSTQVRKRLFSHRPRCSLNQ